MPKFWDLFRRVVKSYNIEEKVLSVVVLIITLIAAIQGVVGVFRDPLFFLNESNFYTEGVVSENPAVINPLYADFSDANRDLSSLVFSGLTKYDPKNRAFIKDLADLTILDNQKTYRFILRDNVLWHDGQKLSADDVYFTYHDLIQNPEFQNPVLKANFDGVKITKVDGKTIDFTIKSPNSFFITNFNIGILPKHLLKDVALADLPYDNFNYKSVGTGPFKVESPMEMLPDGKQRVTLTKFDNYYNELPKIKNIKYYIYPDNQSLLKEKNILDVISKVPRDLLKDIKLDSRFKIENYQLPQYTAVFINMGSAILAKDKVRLALQKSLDKAKLLQVLENKTVIDTPLLELDQSEWLYKPNIEEAKGALFDSGYKMDKDEKAPYRKDSKGNILAFKLLTRSYEKGSYLENETKKVTDFLVESYKNIGVKVEVVSVDPDTFSQKLAARDYDLILTGQSLGYNLDTYSYWHSSQANERGLNLSNYKSFAADALIEKIRTSFDNKEKESYLKQLAKAIAADMPAIFLYRPLYAYASDSKLKGVLLSNLAYIADRYSYIFSWCVNCPG